MKNPWKSCHPLFWVHRVYGIQNERLDLTINEFLTFEKQCIVARDIYNFCVFSFNKFANISIFDAAFSRIRLNSAKVLVEVEAELGNFIKCTTLSEQGNWGKF